MNETQAKLDQAKVKLEQNVADRKTLENAGEELASEIEALMDKLAEEQKPKLRHGDYGLQGGWNECVITRESHKKHLNWTGVDCVSSDNKFESTPEDIWLGNIFDDLKAMQENVTEFGFNNPAVQDNIHVSVPGYNNGIVMFRQGDNEVFIHIERMPDFILKLRQMEATLKRRQK